MTIVWNSTNAFQRHIDDMKSFRRAHPDIPPAEHLEILRVAPPMLGITPLCRTRVKIRFTDSKGKLILIPIWQLTLSQGSEN